MDDSIIELETDLSAFSAELFAQRCTDEGLRVEAVTFRRQPAAPSLAPPANRLLVDADDVDAVRERLIAAEASAPPSTIPNAQRRALRVVAALTAAVLVFILVGALLGS